MVQAIYPGSFDPPTRGHVDLIIRASKLFDHLYVGIGINGQKAGFIDVSERKNLLYMLCKGYQNVSVVSFSGLLIDWCKENGVNVVVRGLRAVTDFEYELMMAHANRTMAGNVETVFLATETETSFVSSSLVREVYKHGGDTSKFVPDVVERYLIKKRWNK